MYIFDLKRYNASSGDRFIIFDDINKKVFKRIIIKDGTKLEVAHDEVLKNVDGYKFKFQKNEDDKWKDIGKYFKLVRSQQLGDYWTDIVDLDEDSLINYITYYTFTETPYSRVKLLKSFKQVCENLWLSHYKKHINLIKYFDFVDKHKDLFNDEWKNINIYLKYLHKLKLKFQSLGFEKLYFPELQPAIFNNPDVMQFIKNDIKELEATELQFAYLLAAHYYSLLNERENAVKCFGKVKSFNNNLEIEFGIGQGSSTYNLLTENSQKHENNVTFYSQQLNIESNYTILVSVDSKYLKRYATIIFFSIVALQKYHFHIHVVGDDKETIKTIEDAQALYNHIKNFTGKTSDIITPTFSYEELPEYAVSIKSFSATARFINASYFMETFNSNLLILDADMFLTDDLTNYLNGIKKYDITIAFSQSVTATLPWRRVMAGNIYLTNNEKARRFIDITSDYIVDNLKETQSWTLDQNALSYAYENIFDYYPEISFGNVYKFNRPFAHPQIRTYIERN